MTAQIIRNQGRISYEKNQLARKEARLATLTVGSPAHANCLRSIAATMALIAHLEGEIAPKLASKPVRQPKQPTGVKRGPKGPQTGVRFLVELGDDLVSNDQQYPVAV